jgi:hypothetical protein
VPGNERRGAMDRGRKEWRPTVVVPAGSETRAELRPAVVVAARSETCAEHVMVVGRGAKGRRPTVVVTAATIRVPETRAELPVVVASSRALETLVELARRNGNGWSRSWMLQISGRVGGSFRWAALAEPVAP